MLLPILVGFLILLVLGMPIAFGLGLASIAAILGSGNLPLLLIPQRMFVQLDSFTLLAVPYFILAGELMERGGISERLLALTNSLIRQVRGGLAHANTMATIVMSGLSGSGVADMSAVGSISAPAMLKKGYQPGFVGAVLAAGGSLGPIIPPSILMIIYGSLTGISIGALFAAGIVPGLLMGLGFMAVIWVAAGKQGYHGEPGAGLREIGRAFVDAIWALIAPVIILGGIISGVFTATEAGAVAALYAFIVGTFVYRQLRPAHYVTALVNTAAMTAVVLIIISAAGIFGWLLQRFEFPTLAAAAILSLTTNPYLVMLLVIVFLMAVGTVVEIMAAAIILIPVLEPIGRQVGFDPLHYAFIIVLALTIGSVTPPVGVFLYLGNTIAKAELGQTIRQVTPFILIMVVVLFLSAYVPEVVLYLPRVFFPDLAAG